MYFGYKNLSGRVRFTALAYLGVIAVTVVGFWSMLSELDQFDAGMQAAKTGDYERAIEYWLPLAHKGQPEAQYNLGVLYEEGRGVAADLEAAAVWYGKAADQGMTLAQVNLGLLHMNGMGVEKDLGLAMQWFRKAADQGSAQAQNNLGNMYLRGIGVEQDYQRAADWFRRAALQGNHRAQFRLGMQYLLGRGVEENPVEASAWLALASSADDNIGALARDTFDDINSSFTSHQLEEASERKQELLEMLVDKSDNASH